MKARAVEFSEEASRDLLDLHDWIAEATNSDVALSYLERLGDYCLGFDLASERGQLRDDLRPGLRVIGFEKRVTIAFFVEARGVIVDAQISVLVCRPALRWRAALLTDSFRLIRAP